MGKKITYQSYIRNLILTVVISFIGLILVVFSTIIKLLPDYCQWIGFLLVIIGIFKSFYDKKGVKFSDFYGVRSEDEK